MEFRSGGMKKPWNSGPGLKIDVGIPVRTTRIPVRGIGIPVRGTRIPVRAMPRGAEIPVRGKKKRTEIPVKFRCLFCFSISIVYPPN